jgi:hypothetical protein
MDLVFEYPGRYSEIFPCSDFSLFKFFKKVKLEKKKKREREKGGRP